MINPRKTKLEVFRWKIKERGRDSWIFINLLTFSMEKFLLNADVFKVSIFSYILRNMKFVLTRINNFVELLVRDK